VKCDIVQVVTFPFKKAHLYARSLPFTNLVAQFVGEVRVGRPLLVLSATARSDLTDAE
jgi:hypothetical protein